MIIIPRAITILHYPIRRDTHARIICHDGETRHDRPNEEKTDVWGFLYQRNDGLKQRAQACDNSLGAQ